MTVSITFYRPGAPDVLTAEETSVKEPGSTEVWIEQEAIGVNFKDLMMRNGAIPCQVPSLLGSEGAGQVMAVGKDVTNVHVGDRVAYAAGPLGAYASGRLFPAEWLIKIPESVSTDQAAAVMFKGITAQYLLKTTYAVEPGTTILMYGVNGGVGQLLATWAKHLGAFVIGVVSKPSSVEKAKALGCDEVLVFDAATLAKEVVRITNGRKVDVVYDCIGRDTFEASLDSLRPRGTLVAYGWSSGLPDPVSIETLNTKGSLFLTRPSLAAHIATVQEYQQRADDVLDAVEQGIITPKIWRTYSLADVAAAHDDVESGRSSGSIILKP